MLAREIIDYPMEYVEMYGNLVGSHYSARVSRLLKWQQKWLNNVPKIHEDVRLSMSKRLMAKEIIV